MYKVCIRCFTYNHSQFIEDAMNGFVMQKTDFPYVAVIVDDASTDNAQQVITDYFNRSFDFDNPSVAFREEASFGVVLFAQHNTNKNCFFAIVLLKENHYSTKKSKHPYLSRWLDDSEYNAICEGDDYWFDPLKLQKQVDLLDKHPEYNICSHDYTRYTHDSLSFDSKSFYADLFSDDESPDRVEYSLDTYFDRWWTQPLTCLYRNGDYLKRIPYESYKFHRDDIFFYYVLKEGKGVLLSDCMGVYRVHQGGVWSGKSLIQRSERAIYNAYNIYLVEGDVRAFNKIDREELRILFDLFNRHSYFEVVRRIVDYRKKAPKGHFHYVVECFRKWVYSKTKQRIRRLIHLEK